MKIDVLTLFPKMFESPFDESIIKRAIKNKLLDLEIHNLRDWAIDDYGSVDDKPFGGDVGMLIRADVVWKALNEIFNFQFSIFNKEKKEKEKLKVLPGITGYNQAYYRNSITSDEKIKNDIYYVNNVSLLLDIKIIIKTFVSVINRDNIYVSK